ncbi:probable glutamate receptor [Zootermopsis nevadensis]|uniref:probable glutamate receptor n=1 Tax=Zootermopsis nevadensis TaxID=136037 RepID=UPI000B8E732B|nr:probable glutamate receptor [Zootermopsis nevadensis]
MMRGVLTAIVILLHSTCVPQESSSVQAQISAHTWLSTSAHVVAAIQKRLHLQCVYVVHNRAVDFDEQRMTSQFWKLLSLHGRQVAFSGPSGLGRTSVCGRSPNLYAIIAADESRSHCIQEFAQKRYLSQGIWLLFLNTTTKEAFEDSNVPFNSLVVVATQTRQRMVILEEVYRVSPHLPLVTRRIGTWNSTTGELSWTRQVDSRSHLHGLTIKAAANHNPPFTVVELNNNRAQLTNGFFGKVWKILEKRIGFSTDWFTPHNTTWNETTANGTELLQLISRKQVDMVVSDVTITPSSADVVTFTVPLLTYRFSVFIRLPDSEDSDWSMYLEPFRKSLWLTVLGAIPIFAIFLSISQYCGRVLRKEESNGRDAQFSFCNSVFYMFGALCQQGTDVTPKETSGRMVYSLFFLSTSVVLAAYSGLLVSFITNKYGALPFSDLDGLLRSGIYSFGVLNNSIPFTYFSGAKPNTTLHRIYSEIMTKDPKNFPKTDEDGFQRICNEKYAYMAPTEYVVSVIEAANCDVVPLPRQYFEKILAIALPSDSEYKNLINHNLRAMTNTGVLKKLKEDTWTLSSPKPKPHWNSVGIKHIAPLLAVLLVGIVTASVLLVFELSGVPVIKKSLLPCFERRLRRQTSREFWYLKSG